MFIRNRRHFPVKMNGPFYGRFQSFWQPTSNDVCLIKKPYQMGLVCLVTSLPLKSKLPVKCLTKYFNNPACSSYWLHPFQIRCPILLVMTMWSSACQRQTVLILSTNQHPGEPLLMKRLPHLVQGHFYKQLISRHNNFNDWLFFTPSGPNELKQIVTWTQCKHSAATIAFCICKLSHSHTQWSGRWFYLFQTKYLLPCLD